MSTIKKITYLTVGQGINLLVNFLFMPYMARAMSYSDYGTYGQVILVFSIISVLFSFGLSQVIYIHLADKEKKSKVVLSSNLVASCCSVFLAFFSIPFLKEIIANGFENQEVIFGLDIIKYSFFFFFFNTSFNAFLIGKGYPEKATVILVIANTLKVFLVIGSVQLFGSLNFVFYSLVIASCLQFLMFLFATKKFLTREVSFKFIKEQIKLGIPLALTGIFGMGILQADAVMVSSNFDVKDYAIYRNGAFEIPFFSTLYASIAAIILPKVAELWNSNEITKIVELKTRVISNSMAIIYPSLFFFLINAENFINLYLGTKYNESAIIFSIFNLTLLIRINDYFDVMIASGNTKTILFFNALVFFLNVFLNYLFISYFGLPGAAIATVVSLSIYAWLHLNYTVNILKTSFWNFFDLKKLGLILGIILSLGFMTNIFAYLLNLKGIIKILFIGVVYLIPIYLIFIKLHIIDRQIINKFVPGCLQRRLNL